MRKNDIEKIQVSERKGGMKGKREIVLYIYIYNFFIFLCESTSGSLHL
jgi:hypothetical protein